MSEDHRQHRKTLYWLVSSLCVIAVAITFAKVKYLDFSLSDKASFYYQADASISFDTEKDQNAHITISDPTRPGASSSRCSAPMTALPGQRRK